MRSSYKPEDVTILLKDITGLVKPLSAEEREPLIQSGTHYCEMLPLEYRPSTAYMNTYHNALSHYAKATADAVCMVAEKIYQEKQGNIVLVSLARAGTPVGILIKHYLEHKYSKCIPHYTISIIRGRGIDHNAMHYILDRHDASTIQFVDGWIGKGAILNVLKEALTDYPNVSASLAVLSDPANLTWLCGTHKDILIPSSCLNCTVSGLISRTFLRNDIIGVNDFHGAAYYAELEQEDLSYSFLHAIEEYFDYSTQIVCLPEDTNSRKGIDEVKEIAEHFGIDNINFIKPGIGEATRVLLRRIPWKILIDEAYRDAPELQHICQLAKEKNVDILSYPLQNYKVCGIIKKCADI